MEVGEESVQQGPSNSEVEIVQPKQSSGRRRKDATQKKKQNTGEQASEGGAAGPSSARRRRRRQRTVSTEEEEELDLKYGARHVITLIIPVSFCMAVVILTMNTIGYYSQLNIYLPYTPFVAKTDHVSELLLKSFGNALIFISFVVCMTFALILLYKYKFYKVLHGWMIGSTLILLSVFTTIYLQEVFKSYNIPIDHITMGFIIWNYGVVGMICIHWMGPLHLQQAYLVMTSALMALTFIKYLPDWTTWAVLFLVSIWDLIAVLCPKGPLRMLVETAQKRNESVFPALIYSSAMVYPFVASGIALTTYGTVDTDAPPTEQENQPSVASPPNLTLTEETTEPQISSPSSETTLLSSQSSSNERPVVQRFAPHRHVKLTVQGEGVSNTAMVQDDLSAHEAAPREGIEGPTLSTSCLVPDSREAPVTRNTRGHVHGAAGNHTRRAAVNHSHGPAGSQAEQEDRGVKLGLGDFIFYSVLVGKASSYGDWNTTIACYIGILIGLCFTLLLLAMFRKALPALPISISFGLIFYFCTRSVITPFCEQLSVRQILY